MSRIVGKALARVDSHAKVTGRAQYAADARVPGTLHGFLVMSTIARGRVTEIDTRDAEAATGVVAVLTHRAMPRLAVPAPNVGFLKSYIPVQDDRVHHSGQPVAVVVARTLEQAQHGAELVRVSYRPEPAQVSLEEAMGDAYVPPEGTDGPNDLIRGDPAAGMAQAAATVDAVYTTPMHHHNPIEPSATTAQWERDRLTVHESTQGISNSRNALARAFGIPVENVRVISPFVGGGFGAKGPVWPHTILTAAAAKVVGSPVKLVLTRAQSYTSNGHRAQAHQRIAIGAAPDGRLTAIEHVTTQQVSRTEESLFNSSEPTRMLYACPNLRSAQRVVRLDLPAQSFMRSPEAVASHGLESALDELSCVL
ncbi:MAG TPA: molybdopterin cofactor-binding domain-containing protein, partial [Pseudonocardia sp.]